MRNSKWGNRFFYGGIAGLILLFYKTAMTILGNDDPESTFGTINMVFEVTLIVFSINIGTRKYRDEILEGYISYKKSFQHSFFIYFIAAFIGNLYKWIDVSFFQDKSVHIKEVYDMITRFYGNEFADTNMKIIEMMASPGFLFVSYSVNTIVTSVIMAAILSLFIMKKKPY